MNEYSAYKMRKSIYGRDDIGEWEKFYFLIIVEHIDWNTGKKTFTSKKHINNWFKRIQNTYGLDTGDSSTETWQTLKWITEDFMKIGMARYENLTLQLIVPDDEGDDFAK